jgi:hypothetical protein
MSTPTPEIMTVFTTEGAVISLSGLPLLLPLAWADDLPGLAEGEHYVDDPADYDPENPEPLQFSGRWLTAEGLRLVVATLQRQAKLMADLLPLIDLVDDDADTFNAGGADPTPPSSTTSKAPSAGPSLTSMTEPSA